MIYSFDLSNYEAGEFTATRYPDNVAVSGDWVCRAKSDEQALKLARKASREEWAAPDTRKHDVFTVTFVDAHKKPGPKPRGAATGRPRLELRLTDEERTRWEAAAEREVLSLSEYVRAAVEARIAGDNGLPAPKS